MELVVLGGLPFNIFDKRNGEDSPLAAYSRALRPEFVNRYLPNSRLLSGKYLDEYNERITKNVKERMYTALESGYGTIVFDGWEDINASPVVNVLLHTEETVDRGKCVFFLKTLYPGSTTMTAEQYQLQVASVMEEFGGHNRVCAVTSDNTSACLIARKMYAEKYSQVVSVNDQAHVADLLMEDVAKLPWMAKVVKAVNSIASELHRHRKLTEKYRQVMEEYNEQKAKTNKLMRVQAEAAGRATASVKPVQSPIGNRDAALLLDAWDSVDGVK